MQIPLLTLKILLKNRFGMLTCPLHSYRKERFLEIQTKQTKDSSKKKKKKKTSGLVVCVVLELAILSSRDGCQVMRRNIQESLLPIHPSFENETNSRQDFPLDSFCKIN